MATVRKTGELRLMVTRFHMNMAAPGSTAAGKVAAFVRQAYAYRTLASLRWRPECVLFIEDALRKTIAH